MAACWILHSRLIYFWRNINISSIFYFSKSTSINTQYSSLWDTLKMMLFTKYLIKWKCIGRIIWKFRYWFNLYSSMELDIERSMLYLSNAPLSTTILHFPGIVSSVIFYWFSTLIYPAHFEDVPCQSGVNHIYEGKNDYVSRQVIYHCKEECLSFIKKQTEIQIYKFYASYAHEIDVKRWICHRSKRNEIQGGG